MRIHDPGSQEIREEIFDDNMTNMKDISNITGGIGNQMADLEKKVEELLKEHGKTPKTDRRGMPTAKHSRILSFWISFSKVRLPFYKLYALLWNFLSLFSKV